MIQAEHITKTFCTAGSEPYHAINDLSCTVQSGCMYGLIGSNGAGKSTFLRLLSGVYRQDSGHILLDGKPVWENPAAKRRILYVPDELYLPPQARLSDMARTYRSLYEHFSDERFRELTDTFRLDASAAFNTFSKGMKRQAATVLALSARPDFLFFDETFDGLDPVMRRLVRQVIYHDIIDRGMTTIVTSHSLRELEDTCDQLALLHRGGVVFEADIQDLKTSLFKVQVAFRVPMDFDDLSGVGCTLLSRREVGSVSTLILRGDRDRAEAALRAKSPLLLDVLPLELEEVFLYEMQALGYSAEEVSS